MRRTLPPGFLFVFLSLLSSSLFAQHDHFAYAITDVNKDGSSWNAVRKLDLETGQYSAVLFDGTDQNAIAYDAASRRPLQQKADPHYGSLLQAPFATGVAAAAYDRKHNRLYFTPMYIDQLRFIDLATMKVFYISDQPFTKLGTMHNDEAKIITRMVIAPDGFGYAISNDGNTLVRFSTGKKVTIEQLGGLVDDPANQGISIHNRCSSFGGDMVADDQGALYILSAGNHVFKVNPDTRVARHLGSIQNLPAGFTVNGAVVDADGNLLVSSAVNGKAYYLVDAKKLTALPFLATNGIYRSSDLANSNFLSSSTKSVVAEACKPTDKFAKLISIYPNPVRNSQVNLQFNKVPAGDYTIELTDILGRSVQQARININSEQQSQSLSVQDNNARGFYMVKVYDRSRQSVFTQKVIVE
jgi:hypothetical protein